MYPSDELGGTPPESENDLTADGGPDVLADPPTASPETSPASPEEPIAPDAASSPSEGGAAPGDEESPGEQSESESESESAGADGDEDSTEREPIVGNQGEQVAVPATAPGFDPNKATPTSPPPPEAQSGVPDLSDGANADVKPPERPEPVEEDPAAHGGE